MAETEFYIIVSDRMRPMEAVGPFEDREVAAKVVSVLQLTKLRYPLSIATRRPVGIPVMPAEMFVVKLETAMGRARAKQTKGDRR